MKRLLKSLGLVTTTLAVSGGTAFANPSQWTVQLSSPYAASGAVATSRTFNLSVSVSSAVASDEMAVTIYQNDSAVIGTFWEGASTFGNSWSVPVSVAADGTYTFKALVQNSNGDPAKQVETTVGVDASAPASPTYGTKSRNGNNYTVTFTAPASDVAQVKVYASTSNSFTANASTLVGSVAASPGQQLSFNYSAPDASERYFAVQAVDAAGNVSSLTGDPIVSGNSGSASATATSGSASTTQGNTDSSSKVASDSTNNTKKSNEVRKQTEDKQTDKKKTNWTVVWVTFGVLAVLYVAYRWFMREVEQD
jgi:hypothetical protein